jgi:hypothetical protein
VASSNVAAPIKGRVYRIVKLDSCGNPVTGTGSGMQIVHSAFTQIGQDPQYEDGVEFFERTASGALCVNQKDDPILKRINLTVDFCAINVTGAAYMMSARELTIGAPTTGSGRDHPARHRALAVEHHHHGSARVRHRPDGEPLRWVPLSCPFRRCTGCVPTARWKR